MTPAKPSVVLDGGRYFEGPRWHSNRLWFVDCLNRTLLSLKLSGEFEQHAKIEDDTPCGLGNLPDGKLIVLTMFRKRLMTYADGRLSLHADLSGIAKGTIDDMIVDGLGRAYEALGQNKAASDAWGRLLALPPSVEWHLHTAQVHDAAQRWRAAAAEWRAALAAAPENRQARMGLGWALFRSRDYDAAMDTVRPLLRGEDAGVQFLYGASLLNLQQPADAIPYLRAAIARDAGLLPARAALGQGLLQNGHAEEAIPLLREAIAMDADGNTHFQLFRAYQLTHREAEAREALADYQRFRSSLIKTVP